MYKNKHCLIHKFYTFSSNFCIRLNSCNSLKSIIQGFTNKYLLLLDCSLTNKKCSRNQKVHYKLNMISGIIHKKINISNILIGKLHIGTHISSDPFNSLKCSLYSLIKFNQNKSCNKHGKFCKKNHYRMYLLNTHLIYSFQLKTQINLLLLAHQDYYN